MLTLKHWYDLEFLKLYFVSFSLKLNFRKRYKINLALYWKVSVLLFYLFTCVNGPRYISLLTITYLQDNESRCARFKKRHTMKDRIWCYCKTKLVKRWSIKCFIEWWKWNKRFWNKEVCNLFCCDRRTKTGTESSTRGRMVDFVFACSDGLPLSYRNLTYWRY